MPRSKQNENEFTYKIQKFPENDPKRFYIYLPPQKIRSGVIQKGTFIIEDGELTLKFV